MTRSALGTRVLYRVVGLAICAAAANTASAADYYVSSQGRDDYDGLAPTAGLGATGPFATLARLTKLNLQHGDRIFLACGQRFQGPVRLALNSTLPGVLTITRFGTCQSDDRPVIDGRVPLPATGGPGLKSLVTAEPVAQVFDGDMPLPRARFPANKYLVYPATVTSAIDRLPADPTLSGKDLAGAIVHARTQEWIIEERLVKTSAGQLDAPLQYPLRHKAGAYLTGKVWMIGAEDGWAYDRSSQTLHVRSKAELTGSLVAPLLQITGRGAVAISGLAFFAAGSDAINLKLDGVVNISEVAIRYAAENGIAIAGASFVQITNSTIQDTSRDGIFFAEVKRVVVRRNVVTNAGLYLGPSVSLAAINAHRTDAATIEENEVKRSAYIGIRFAGDARIRGNLVEASCLYLADCGAIYTWRRNAADIRPPVEVSGNAIVDVDGDTSVKFGVTDYFSGIYLDEWTRATTVVGNVIINAGQGVYLHNARGNVVEGNYVLGVRGVALPEKDDAPELLNPGSTRKEVPNRIGMNTLLKDPSEWSHHRLDLAAKRSTAKLRILTGLKLPGRPHQGAAATQDCRELTLGASSAAVNSTAVQVFSCD